MTLRIGWYTTARGMGSRKIFAAVKTAIDSGFIDAEIKFVFINRAVGESESTDAFIEELLDQDIPVINFSSVQFRKEMGVARAKISDEVPSWRQGYDAEVANLVRPYGTDIGVLAGYMLIFSPDFVNAHVLLNLHPALPDGPIGTWQKVIETLISDRETHSGVMAHVAIPEVDKGPVATYCKYPIRGEGPIDLVWQSIDESKDTSVLFNLIREIGMSYEAPFLVATLQQFTRGIIRLESNQLNSTESIPIDVTEATLLFRDNNESFLKI
jgi:folate-dependent phosphoribosylglycinamide formyltransferase PurN